MERKYLSSAWVSALSLSLSCGAALAALAAAMAALMGSWRSLNAATTALSDVFDNLHPECRRRTGGAEDRRAT